jgi:hypothetical protein
MGDAKRRRIAGSWKPFVVKEYWWEKQSWTVEELRERAERIVPKELALQFWIDTDCERCYVPWGAPASFPQSWSYDMRCVEFYFPAMQWIKTALSVIELSDKKAKDLAFTNAVKLFVIAASSEGYKYSEENDL